MYRNWSQLKASSHEPGCRPDSARFPRFRLVFFDVFTWKGGLARFPKISVIKRAGNFAIWTLSLVAGVKAGWILAVRMASSCIACYIFHVIRWERLAHQLGFPFSKSSCFNFRTFHVPNGTVVWGRGGESPHGLGGGDVWHFRFLHISDNAPYLAPKILHNLCFSFLLGITAVPREIENNAPNQKNAASIRGDATATIPWIPEVFRDRGDHFKVVGLKNLANARNIKFSVLPFIWHLRAILFTSSTNII